MSNINFELNLNQHPKNAINRSLINAKNVQLSNDLSCLQSEFAIKRRSDLDEILTNKYIAGYIPCNKEFILFVAPKDYKTQLTAHPEGIQIDIYRYKEQGTLTNNIVGSFDNATYKKVYEEFIWHGGKLKGTFTYNIKSHLIIAVAESDTLTGELIPLKTINLGTYDSTVLDADTDLSLDDSKLSLNPELKIPSITDYDYVQGLSYKGWYTIFIRYKINSVDYTKWFHIGYPIFVDELENVQILNYFLQYGEESYPEINLKVGCGITDFISSGSNTCNTGVVLHLDHKTNLFDSYQIGVIISTKDTTRAFKSLDLNYAAATTTFFINVSSMEESSINELTFTKYNYYDVKNIINYKNRLYLSNYKETSFNKTKAELQTIADNLTVKVVTRTKSFITKVEPVPFTGTLKLVFYTKPEEAGGPSYTNNFYQEYEVQVSELNIFFNIDIELFRSTSENSVLACDVYRNGILSDSFIFLKVDPNGVITEEYDSAELQVDAYTIGNFVLTNKYFGSGNTYGTFKVKFNYNRTQSTNLNAQENYYIRLKETTLIPGDIYNLFVHFVNKYGEITDGIPLKNIQPNIYFDDNQDGITANTRIQRTQAIQRYDDGFMIKPYYAVKHINGAPIGTLRLYGVDIENINLITDSGFVGFFVSYEKVQKVVKFTGYVTPYQYKYEEQITDDDCRNNIHFTRYWDKESEDNKYRFYCNDIDLLDNIELNFKYLRIEKYNFTGAQKTSNPNVIPSRRRNQGDDMLIAAYSIDSDTSFDNSANLDEMVGNLVYKDIEIINASLVLAHNFSKNNQYRGSYIELTLAEKIPDSYKEIITYVDDGVTKTTHFLECKACLIGPTDNLYLSNNKILMKLSNIHDLDTNIFNIRNGFNGRITYNGALIYNNDQVILNSGYNILLNSQYYSYIKSNLYKDSGGATNTKISEGGPYLCMMAKVSMLVYSDIIHDSRCFNTLPEIIITRNEAISDKVSQTIFEFGNNVVVLPMNSIDLYKERFGTQDSTAPITYINYVEGFISQFNKRVIRSNPIADESFENSWRTINPESYKDITENKGNITNIIALGTTLLVHTEHGLFMFDRDNTLQNGEGNTMQLAMPDIFDVDYKEVIASNLGNCGLQDSEAWILDEFGYIFYDNDAHRFYKFGSKNIEIIDTSIEQFVNKYKPYKVRFINDSESNRILVDILYQIDSSNDMETNELTLSYNTKINKWISTHSYNFDRGFSTKQMTYFILDKSELNTNNIISYIYLINRLVIEHQNMQTVQNLIYSQFENIRNNNEIQNQNCSISIIVNDKYELIKTLEYLSWKLYKIKANIADESAYNFEAREYLKKPYSGYTLRVYNDQIDTGIIDISCNTESNKNTSVMNYKKPWWQFGNWNFNYLRDIKNSNNNLKAQFMSRLYGNYFIIELTFGDASNRVEFETLDCKLISNRTI